MAHRRKTKVKRGDMIDLILATLEASENVVSDTSPEYQMDRDEFETALVSSTFSFFFAGLETISSWLSVTMAFLSLNKQVQEKLHMEIRDLTELKAGGGGRGLDFADSQWNLPYLDMVLDETLRFYFNFSLDRVCTKDYPLPGSNFILPKGSFVRVPTGALLRDERYFPDPDHFNPDANFSKESKSNRSSAFTLLPFSLGPRNCTGKRLAIMIAKLCLVEVVDKFIAFPGQRLPKEFVMSYKSTFSGGMPKGGVWCKLEKRKKWLMYQFKRMWLWDRKK